MGVVVKLQTFFARNSVKCLDLNRKEIYSDPLSSWEWVEFMLQNNVLQEIDEILYQYRKIMFSNPPPHGGGAQVAKNIFLRTAQNSRSAQTSHVYHPSFPWEVVVGIKLQKKMFARN